MKNLVFIATLLILTSGCSTIPKKDYTAFESAQLRSILVIPVVNKSVDVDAPDYFLSTIAIPVAEQGYYVFPVNMIKRVLEDDGLSDANLVHDAPVEKLAALFGADAVLYVTIKRWDARYVLLTTTVTIQIAYVIKDGRTGATLWQDERHVQYSPSSSSSGNPIADLVAMAVTAAVTKAAPNYMPLVHQANAATFAFPGPGIPPGPYLRKEENVDLTQKVQSK